MKLSHSYSAIKMYEDCPLRYYRQRILKEVQDQGNQYTVYGERVHEALEKRLRDNEELSQDMARYEPLITAIESSVGDGQLYVEYEACLNDELKSTEWFAPDAWFRGKLDVLIVKGDTAVVMDWKTGRRKGDFDQLELFSLLTWKMFPEVQTVRASFVWLKDMAMDHEVYERKDANDLWAKHIGRIRRIYDSVKHDNWPAKPSGLCRFCPCRHDCDYMQ